AGSRSKPDSMAAMPARPPLNDDFERRPYWHATMPALPDRTGKPLPDAADAVVIGGGYTGLAAARNLASQGASAVVLEARTLGWGASTRNGGIAHPGYKWGPASLVKRYGQELATRLYADSVEATQLIGRTIREAGIEAELRLNGYMELAWSRRDAEDFADEVPVRTSWGTPARVVPREELAGRSGRRRTTAAWRSTPAASCIPASGSRGWSAWPRRPGRTSTKGSMQLPFDASPTGASWSRPTAGRSSAV